MIVHCSFLRANMKSDVARSKNIAIPNQPFVARLPIHFVPALNLSGATQPLISMILMSIANKPTTAPGGNQAARIKRSWTHFACAALRFAALHQPANNSAGKNRPRCGSTLWRACVTGRFEAVRKMQELEEHSGNEFFLMDHLAQNKLSVFE
jgi:hypothetical protein